MELNIRPTTDNFRLYTYSKLTITFLLLQQVSQLTSSREYTNLNHFNYNYLQYSYSA